MSKNKLIHSLWLMTAMFLSLSAIGQWAVVGSAGFSTGSVTYTSMVIGANDTPFVGYIDNGNSNKATVMKYNGSSWVAAGTAGFSSAGVNYISMAKDASNNLYIAFQDSNASNKATVMKYSGSTWTVVGSAGFSAGVATSIDIAIDGTGAPYVTYSDDANSDKATVMKYNGVSWSVLGSAGFSSSWVEYNTIAIGKNDTPYVAFRDGANSNKATIMKYDGSSWSVVGSAGISAGAIVFSLSLESDTTGNLYLGYRDQGNSNKATLMKYSAGSWSALGGVAFSASVSLYVNVLVDGTTPYAAYRDNTAFKAIVMKYNGSNWENVGNTSFSAGTNEYNSLAIDSKGDLYLAYRDGGNSSKATVFKYEFPNIWNGSTWSKGNPSSTSDVQIGSNTTPTSFTCNDLTINSGFSLNTGTSEVVTIHGDLTNSGNGVSGTGTLTFTKSGTASINGDTVGHEGTVIVESGCTLTTNSKLRLKSNATNTGRIGESDGTISGNVYVQRYMPGKRCFRFYGHPFSSSIALSQLTDEIDITGSGGAANGFTATVTNNPSAFYFDVDSADNSTGLNPGWQPFTSANTSDWDQYELLRLLVRGAKGEGLTGGAYTPTAATFEAAGAVNQGTQVVTLTKGSNSTFVGCGNPFPSPVEMDKVTVGSNVGANYYAWDATSGASGAYVTNAWTLPYDLPAYTAFFTNVSANSNNTLTFEEADKVATGAGLFKTTGAENWVELYIYDSTTKWDRLLINFNTNGMEVEDKLDGKKLYNPNLDFFTLSKDDVRLAVDVRPYQDSSSIPLGLTAYNRYNRYVIKVGMFDVPVGTKLFLHDKHLNTKQEITAGYEYWFDVTVDSSTQGNNRFEINMVGKPTTSITNVNDKKAAMQLIPNPAYNHIKVSFKAVEGTANLTLSSVTGQVVYAQEVSAGTGSVNISLTNIPAGVYIVELKGDNAIFTQKLIKE